MKTNENKRGISLIVLVITIVVMIILAAAIILNLDDTKIINNAEKAVGENNLAVAKEIRVVAKTEWRVNEEKLGKEHGTFGAYLIKQLEAAGVKMGDEIGEVKVKSDGTLLYNAEPVVPKGFVASEVSTEDQITEGFVIYEGTQPVTSRNVEDAKKTRNQFVWVPVSDFSEFERKDFGYYVAGVSFNDLSEPSKMLSEANDATGEYAEYAAIRASVQKYGGFYIARYEPGKETVDGADILVSKKSAQLWGALGWGPSMTSMSAGYAVDRARNMHNASDAKTNLIYGVQWDATMNFISDSVNIADGRTWGNYANSTEAAATNSGTLQNCGANDAWVAKNIYDLAGNAQEFTMEDSGDGARRVVRGGHFSQSGHVSVPSYRSKNVVKQCDAYTSFRVAMYIV